jgi:hypothetical protein
VARRVGARVLSQAFAILLVATVSAHALDLDELTVVTMARDGSSGLATAGSQGQATAAAIRDCRVMAGAPSDCGAQFATTRGGWIIANLCGDHRIIVAAETREAAELAAIARDTDLRGLYVQEMPPCRRILAADPRGAVLVDQAVLNASD